MQKNESDEINFTKILVIFWINFSKENASFKAEFFGYVPNLEIEHVFTIPQNN